MQFVIATENKGGVKTYSVPCPINVMYNTFKEAKFYVNEDDPNSKFNWGKIASLPMCPEQWTPKEGGRSMKVLGIEAGPSPKAADMFRGVCDAEVFSYTTSLVFTNAELAILTILIDQGPIAGHAALESACRLRAAYRVRGNWSSGYVDLVHLTDAVYDSDNCWMQPIPQTIRAQRTTAGSNYGIWITHNTPYCSDQHLRYGTVESTLQEGDTLINEMTMESPYAQLIMHKDGNIALYGYESDYLLWESNTGVAGNSPVEGALTIVDGIVSVQTTSAGKTVRTVLNQGSAVGGRFLAVYKCDLQLYPDSLLIPSTSLWNATGRDCPDVVGKRAGPKWHRGGSYWLIYRRFFGLLRSCLSSPQSASVLLCIASCGEVETNNKETQQQQKMLKCRRRHSLGTRKQCTSLIMSTLPQSIPFLRHFNRE
eukprot:PhF_6_TR3464/c1_g1_i1/m.5072